MKTGLFKTFYATGLLFAGLAMAPIQASAVNISIGLGGEVLPGVYGTVNIDNGRYPALVYAEPLIVTRPSRVLPPLYLHVPPGHLRKWGSYCGSYGACSRPVYFVRSRDYYDFSPRYIEPRYIYRDRITYVNPRIEHHRHYDERREYRHHDRRGDDRGRWQDDKWRRGGDERHWRRDDNGWDHGRGNGRHWDR